MKLFLSWNKIGLKDHFGSTLQEGISMEELYKQEILELTELLNEDENWEDLKNILLQSKVDLNKTILVSFMEDDEGNEYGILVNNDLKIFRYVRKTQEGENNPEHFEMADITEDEEELSKYPQIAIAINMIKKGELV